MPATTSAKRPPKSPAEPAPLQAEFLTTVAQWSQLPPEDEPEVAFAGRSNAGKSSAINVLANRRRLAFASKTPGRTQHLNFFAVRGGGRLVDLPGYGYAAAPAEIRAQWPALLERFLRTRPNLAGMVLIMDARHPMTELDCRMLDWWLDAGKPARILLTKSDKLTRSQALAALRATRDRLARDYPRCEAQLFSSRERTGIAEALDTIAGWLGLTKKKPLVQGGSPGAELP
jgi:GTP-binding protein